MAKVTEPGHWSQDLNPTKVFRKIKKNHQKTQMIQLGPPQEGRAHFVGQGRGPEARRGGRGEPGLGRGP